jgi:two-component system cell cycle sensor histidine kinase/response regulator CckA
MDSMQVEIQDVSLFENIISPETVAKKGKGKRTERILAVEDGRFGRAAIERVLDRAGYAVTVVPDLDSALDALAHSHFDLVISDFRMPGGTGLELLVEAQRLKPSTPFLFLSGETDTELQARARELGALAFIEKPASLHTLLNHMHRTLGH